MSTMDTSGFSQIGRYGTISLMKRGELNVPITAFGIDMEELTFGRDPTCGVRLYYPDVSLIHCKVVFEERKAFLVVLGPNGLVVDGCKVYPNGSPALSAAPTMIPLTNNSEFEIHGKRFRFTYPPKEMRAALLATPARPHHRALRLSMIQSAQVFSPRPSHDPRENLRVLKSPLKNTFRTPQKSGLSTPIRKNLFASPSPMKSTLVSGIQEAHDEEEEEEEIVLVDGNHPRVVEEDKDLVILEDVEISHPIVGFSSQPSSAYQSYVTPPPQTPARSRSLSRNSLHRAVLIRSAQRAVLKAERADREREEEEEEEMEVLETVASEVGNESDEDAPMDVDEHVEDFDAPLGDEEDEADEEEENEGQDNEEEGNKSAQKYTWRKSLERLWPFRSSSPHEEEDENKDDEEVSSDQEEKEAGVEPAACSDSEAEEQDENPDIPAPLPSRPIQTPQAQTPIRRPLGSFMTPQVHARSKVSSSSNPFSRPHLPTQAKATGTGRYSLGGGEARRVIRTEQVWKVRDIVVPLSQSTSTTSGNHSSPTGSAFVKHSAPGASVRGPDSMASPMRPTPRRLVNEEERKAIQERRRSALRDMDSFFPGGIPGMSSTSPSKPLGWSPAKTSHSSSSSASSSSAATPFRPSSPTKPVSVMKMKSEDGTRNEEDEDEMMDTRRLLERMKETVEGMKRRRSLATPVGTPARPEPFTTPARHMTRPVSPSKAAAALRAMDDVVEEGEDKDEDKDNQTMEENDAEETTMFSLLRPGAIEEARLASREENLATEEVPAQRQEDDTAMEVDGQGVEDTHATVFVPVLAEDQSDLEDTPVDDVPLKKTGRGRQRKIASPEVDEEPKTKTKVPARRARIAQQTASTSESIPHDDELPARTAKTAPRRGRKSAAAEPESEETPNEPAALAPTRRGRKAATVEPEEPAAPVPARRGRKLTVEANDELSKVENTIPVKKGRKPSAASVETEESDEAAPALAKRSTRKIATAHPVPEDAAEESQPVARRGRPPRAAPAAIPISKIAARRNNDDQSSSGSGGVKKGTRSKPIEVEEETDPLDSIEADEVPAVPKLKGRKKAVPVKEEVDEDVDTAAAPATRATRAKPTGFKAPVVKSRTVKKTPATAPAAVQREVNKENTPGSEDMSNGDNDEPVNVRVSRTTRKVASRAGRSTKVKQEEAEEVPEPQTNKGRVMRATRARTRT